MPENIKNSDLEEVRKHNDEMAQSAVRVICKKNEIFLHWLEDYVMQSDISMLQAAPFFPIIQKLHALRRDTSSCRTVLENVYPRYFFED